LVSTSIGYEVDFLPVGKGESSGDAIALRFGYLLEQPPRQRVVIIDGGFQASGEALVKHVKKYYKTSRVDLVVSTHPDTDHVNGLEVVLEELSVGCLWMHLPWNHTDDIAGMFRDGRVTDNSVREALRRSLDAARNLENLAKKKRIHIIEPFAGVRDDSGFGCVLVIGPAETFYEDLLPDFRGTPEPKGSISLLAKAILEARQFVSKVAESLHYETLDDSGETSAENNSSVILLVVVDGHYLLFTGDAGIPALTAAADLLEGVLDSDYLKSRLFRFHTTVVSTMWGQPFLTVLLARSKQKSKS